MTHLISLADALGPIRDVYAHLLTPAAEWRENRARRIDLDHFTLICVAADRGFGRAVTPTRWTRTDVYHVLRCDVPNWCSMNRCLWPVELPEVMWNWFDFLAETGRLDRTSDPIAELRKPVGVWCPHVVLGKGCGIGGSSEGYDLIVVRRAADEIERALADGAGGAENAHAPSCLAALRRAGREGMAGAVMSRLFQHVLHR